MKNVSNFCDSWSIFTLLTAQTNINADKQTRFKLSDDNTFNKGTTGKGRFFWPKKYENRSICSKIIDEQTLMYVYIYIYIYRLII